MSVDRSWRLPVEYWWRLGRASLDGCLVAETASDLADSGCGWQCHVANGWRAASQVISIRPDAGGAQDNLIALGNSMDTGWRQRYTDSLSGSGDWIGGTRGDLTSGDVGRIARGYAGVLVFSTNFIPGGGAGVAAVEDAGRVAITEAADHAPQIENTIKDVAESCAINSFVAGTLVLLADGSRKAIERLRVGDQIEAGDPQKGVNTAEPVQRVIIGNGLKHLVSMSVGGDKLSATYNHPFWVVEDQRFEWASDLKPGKHLLLADGLAPRIDAVGRYDESTTVYNLSIATIHTYFVGETGVLVHNACGPDPSAIGAHTSFERDATTGQVTRYVEYRPNPMNPSGFDDVVRFDRYGPGHFNKVTRTDVPTPHLHDPTTPGGIRAADPWEIPQ